MKYIYYDAELIRPQAGIFVFGSNLAGRHGKGAALVAKQHYGAIQGQEQGFTGKSYAIPTKDWRLVPLELHLVAVHIKRFQEAAYKRTYTLFWVTKIGCGLAGYNDSQIAPLFRDSPDNCIFHRDWSEYLE